MVQHKRRYTRAELVMTKRTMGVRSYYCTLCFKDVEHHKDDCVLADVSVTSIVVIKSRAGIVFRMDGTRRRWWWTSRASGKEYHIEKLPGRYQMSDSAGNSLVSRKRLSDLRNYLALNQGRY